LSPAEVYKPQKPTKTAFPKLKTHQNEILRPRKTHQNEILPHQSLPPNHHFDAPDKMMVWLSTQKPVNV
jgi:hypothetical protein